MSNYDNNNRGSIWKNEDRKSDTHPQFKGSAEVNGVEYWVSGWLRKADANPKAPAMSFSFTAKEQQSQQSQAAPKQAPANDFDLDESIPF
jgi:hypothetical protein